MPEQSHSLKSIHIEFTSTVLLKRKNKETQNWLTQYKEKPRISLRGFFVVKALDELIVNKQQTICNIYFKNVVYMLQYKYGIPRRVHTVERSKH